jgi:2-oxopent-4-enoate/cis-2-oxohex-4-enoate hydratase
MNAGGAVACSAAFMVMIRRIPIVWSTAVTGTATLGGTSQRPTRTTMPLTNDHINTLGDELYDAWRECRVVEPLTSRFDGLTVDDAYHVQKRTIERRVQAGERHVGKKIGLTARVVQQVFGVDQPDFGHLLSGMGHHDGAALNADQFIQPKGEGEMGFLLRRDLAGPGVTAMDVLAATESVMPCFEIVDSRIRDWKIAVQDTVADNGSSAAFVVGNQAISPHGLDLGTVGMVLEKNGEIIGTGAGAATLDHPLNAVAWLANALGRQGITLRAGELILSGSLSIMFPVRAGDHLRVTLGGIGSASCRFV